VTRQPREVTLAGRRALVWRAAGAAPPLVLLHGFVGRPESFTALAGLLPSCNPTVAISLPGHDDLLPPDPRGGFAGAVGGIARAVQELGGAGVDLVGYSMGARLALGLLVERPGLVRRATLIGVHPGLRSAAEREARALQDGRWIELLRTAPFAVFLDAWQAQPLFTSQQTLPAEVRRRQSELRALHDPGRLALALETMGLAAMPDYWPHLEAIETPLRIVAGEYDGKFRGLLARIAEHRPVTDVALAPRAGHNVVLERPEWLAEFLSS